jgi:hypothetical protein
MRRAKRRTETQAQGSPIAQSTLVAGVAIFVVIPLLLFAIGALISLPGPRVRLLAFRSFLVLTLCLLPATMWYLFIVTRKASLLNDFVTNLNRLGLLTAQEFEGRDESARRRRIYAYLQKFEATYGPLSSTVKANILSGTFNPNTPEESSTKLSNKPFDVISTTTTVPVVLATVLMGLGWLVTLPPSHESSDPLEIVGQPLTYAFLGAYFFSLQMLFRRYVRKDLRGSAYVMVAMRIMLAVIGTKAAVTGLEVINPGMSPTSLLVVGFTIGVFPKVTWQIIQTAVRQVTGFAIPSLRTESPVTDLDGLTVWHEARFEEEDIENVANMASADIVELLLNTRMPPNRIIDWVDEAVLYTYLGQGDFGRPGKRARDDDRRIRLRGLGIRTATSFIELPLTDPTSVEALRPADLAEVSSLAVLQEAVKTDANLLLVRRWRGLQEPTVLVPDGAESVHLLHGRDAGPSASAATPPSRAS